MLDYLKDKKDVGFFLSVQALMQTCRSVMNLHFTFLLLTPLVFGCWGVEDTSHYLDLDHFK